MKTDIEIARSIVLEPIEKIADQVAIPTHHLEHYGRSLAKVDLAELSSPNKPGKLILVTAITPTKAGIGKTTVSIGLALGMNRLGKKAVVALREPSLGPCFGMKGGAAGGGYAQVLPMEKINLHFTGDFHAITSAHNMITALLDNYIYQNRNTDKGLSEVLWKRVLDINDRSLRSVVTGLGGTINGVPAESGFDITPASEIMAILCLSTSLDDLRRRLENILLGYTKAGEPFTVRDLGVAGAITVLLLDAIKPNLAQTTEHTPAFIHGGPFANIAHGCNSILATRMALAHSEYTITEAGFGADLGAEKFYNIKCRTAGLQPALTVLVATLGGLKMHGGVDEKSLKEENLEGVRQGLTNLDRHIANLQSFGQTVVVAFNRFATDTDREIELVREHCQALASQSTRPLAKAGRALKLLPSSSSILSRANLLHRSASLTLSRLRSKRRPARSHGRSTALDPSISPLKPVSSSTVSHDTAGHDSPFASPRLSIPSAMTRQPTAVCGTSTSKYVMSSSIPAQR